MPSEFVSPLAKAGTGAVVAVVQMGLLVLLTLDAVRAPAPDQGGAPVIELTLTPRAAFNRENGSTDSTAAKAEDAAETPRKPTLKTAPTPLEARVAPTPLPALETTPVALASGAPAPLATILTEGAGRGEASADGARDSRRGMTGGGAAATSGANAGAQVDDYYAQVLRWVETHKRHPGGVTGVVTVVFTLDRRGRVSNERILTGSGRSALDAATLSQIKAAEPFPRPSSDTTWRTREFRVRLDYRPREGGRAAR
ncbi:energy transducer TonB family protein [Brevundimonas sp. SL130]|uniref:energy transducer TonB family protein n=1 Tax=Brevundimonas sp. SL130 TaxID=2995143 RepID=UPI00226C761F|nr:TonB family protein [Brevundimonas sp. SL130]WAC59124.1 TonB family protein [Brevundimonas sp. SL130]